MKQRIARWLIKIGYRLIGPRDAAGVIVNPRGKWQAIKL